ncbi:hypothetical protein G9A89_004191 [Geosiphon pyriformis]|nr:hypothetical protein G9A89_004191 [Geosiphon pyriformis]
MSTSNTTSAFGQLLFQKFRSLPPQPDFGITDPWEITASKKEEEEEKKEEEDQKFNYQNPIPENPEIENLNNLNSDNINQQNQNN